MERTGISFDPMESDMIISSPTLQNILVTVNGSSDAHPGVILHLHNQVKGWKTWKFRRKFASNGASTMEKCFVHVQTTPWLHPIIPSINDFRFASFLAALLKLDLWATDTGNPNTMIISVSKLDNEKSHNPFMRSVAITCIYGEHFDNNDTSGGIQSFKYIHDCMIMPHTMMLFSIRCKNGRLN